MGSLISKPAFILAAATGGCPVMSTIVVILFYFGFNAFEATIETVAFGSRFSHWLDPVFIACFIGYAAYCVYACAVHNSTKKI